MPTLTVYETKNELRAVAKNIAKEPDLKDTGKKITNSLKNSPYFHNAENIFAFYPTAIEPDISDIFKISNKRIFIPEIYGTEMKMSLFDENRLFKNKYGIFESKSNIFKTPDKNDLILIPALGADLKFNRLGHGGGFYDRFLKDTNAFKMIILPEKLLFEDVFPEEHDIACDGILTEDNFYLRET